MDFDTLSIKSMDFDTLSPLRVWILAKNGPSLRCLYILYFLYQSVPNIMEYIKCILVVSIPMPRGDHPYAKRWPSLCQDVTIPMPRGDHPYAKRWPSICQEVTIHMPIECINSSVQVWQNTEKRWSFTANDHVCEQLWYCYQMGNHKRYISLRLMTFK